MWKETSQIWKMCERARKAECWAVPCKMQDSVEHQVGEGRWNRKDIPDFATITVSFPVK